MDTRFRTLVKVLVALPLVLVPAAAYLFLTFDGGGDRLALAQGSPGGTLHPVAGSFTPDDTELSGCDGDYRCLEQGFGNVAYVDGPRTALVLFEERMTGDERVFANCHRIAHWIGSATLARNDGDVARTFAEGSPACASGFYHGILERAFAGVSSRPQLGRLARSLCEGQGLRRRGFLDRQCRHGLGHGLMIQTGYDLPLALRVCGGLATGWDRVTCANGVFMENVNTSFGFRSRWLDDEDPLYPCAVVAAIHRQACYQRTATRALELTGYDFAAAADACARVGAPWAPYCFRGLGRDAVDARYGIGEVLRRCAAASRLLGDCLYGAARTVMDRWGAPRAASLCGRAPADARSRCFGAIGGVLGLRLATPSARERACARLAPGHRLACVGAAAAEVDPAGVGAWG